MIYDTCSDDCRNKLKKVKLPAEAFTLPKSRADDCNNEGRSRII